jgi:hypothetical protein
MSLSTHLSGCRSRSSARSHAQRRRGAGRPRWAACGAVPLSREMGVSRSPHPRRRRPVPVRVPLHSVSHVPPEWAEPDVRLRVGERSFRAFSSPPRRVLAGGRLRRVKTIVLLRAARAAPGAATPSLAAARPALHFFLLPLHFAAIRVFDGRRSSAGSAALAVGGCPPSVGSRTGESVRNEFVHGFRFSILLPVGWRCPAALRQQSFARGFSAWPLCGRRRGLASLRRPPRCRWRGWPVRPRDCGDSRRSSAAALPSQSLGARRCPSSIKARLARRPFGEESARRRHRQGKRSLLQPDPRQGLLSPG